MKRVPFSGSPATARVRALSGWPEATRSSPNVPELAPGFFTSVVPHAPSIASSFKSDSSAVNEGPSAKSAADAVENIRQNRKGVTLGGIKIKDLIHEGHRF